MLERHEEWALMGQLTAPTANGAAVAETAAGHTPGRWRLDISGCIQAVTDESDPLSDELVAWGHDESGGIVFANPADAERMLLAVNNHDALVAALRDTREYFNTTELGPGILRDPVLKNLRFNLRAVLAAVNSTAEVA